MSITHIILQENHRRIDTECCKQGHLEYNSLAFIFLVRLVFEGKGKASHWEEEHIVINETEAILKIISLKDFSISSNQSKWLKEHSRSEF